MKIAIIGYGRMGKEIESIAKSRGHEISLIVDHDNAKNFDKEQLANSDVAIEFSVPESAYDNILSCMDASLPVVVGTTGWLNKMDEIRRKCEEENKTFFYASNFSIGVNMFFEINRRLAQLMNHYPNYDPSVEEIHHIKKLDSPSGTAITIANDIIENLNRKSNCTPAPSTNENELQVASLRTSGVPGTHITRYFSEIDSIEIKHIANGRKGFALGAVIAAEWVQGKTGYFGMKDLLGL